MEDEAADKEERSWPAKPQARKNPQLDGTQAPGMVKPVPRLSRDLAALQQLFSDEHPPHPLVRGQLINAVKYAFGDASKAGFGSSWLSEMASTTGSGPGE